MVPSPLFPARVWPCPLLGAGSGSGTSDAVSCRELPCLRQTLALFFLGNLALISWVTLGESPTLSGSQ